MGTWNLTGQQTPLSEDLKTFIDDLYDWQIINISKKFNYPDIGVQLKFINMHGVTMGIPVKLMQAVSDYCKFLIDIGAVKSAKVEDTEDTTEPSISIRRHIDAERGGYSIYHAPSRIG